MEILDRKINRKINRKNKPVSIAFAVIGIIFVLCITLYGIWATELQFSSVTLEVTPEKVNIDEAFTISTTIGGSGNEIVDGKPFVIRIDNTNLIFPAFDENGNYEVTLPNGTIVSYHIEYNEDDITITSSPINQGDTVSMQLRGYFNPDTTKNGEDANITIEYEDNIIKETIVTANAAPNWSNDKTGTSSIEILKGEQNVIINDISYTITGSTLNTNLTDLPADSIIKNATMTDTILFPDGLAIKAPTDGANINSYLIQALGISVLETKNLEIFPEYDSNGNICKVSFSWEELNTGDDEQLDNVNYSFSLNKECLIVDEKLSNGATILNTIDSSCITKLDSIVETENKTVETTITTKDVSEYVNNINKKIINISESSNVTIDQWGTISGYTIIGDYILYEISSTYNGPTVNSITITDYLPKEFVTITQEELNQTTYKYDNTNYQNPIGSFNENVTISTDENGNILWTYNNVNPGDTLHGYVYVRSNENVNSWLENKVGFENKYASNWIENKTKDENVFLEKTNSFSGIKKGQEFYYTILIKNNGTTVINNRTLKDLLPTEVEYISYSITHIGANSSISDIIYSDGAISATNINIGIGEYIEIQINVKTKEDVTSNKFTNTAYLYLNDNIEKESSIDNIKAEDQIENGEILFDKTVDKSMVFPSEVLTYSITLYNNTSSTISLSEEPFVITDNLPEQVNYISSYYTKSQGDGTQFTDGVSLDGNILTWTYAGTIKPGETIKLTITCEVKDNDELDSSGQIINSAILHNITKTVSTELIKEDDFLKVEKIPISEKGEIITNGEISVGEIVTFRIKVENPSSSNTTYNELLYFDEIFNPEYEFYNAYGYMENITGTEGILNFTVVEQNDKVKNFANTGDILTLQHMWGTKFSYFTFLITGNPEKQYNNETIYYNENFSIEPGGYIILDYKMRVTNDQNNIKNKITVNEKFEDITDILTTSRIPSLKFEKESLTSEVTTNDISSHYFDYTFRITNISEDETASITQLKITDIIPEGMKTYGYWAGDVDGIYCDVYYSGYNANLWMNYKGGQYYSYMEDGNLVIEFGSKDDNGQTTTVELKKDEYYLITIRLVLTEEKLNEIYELQNTHSIPNYGIKIDNTAFLESKIEIKNENGNIVDNISDSDSFVIKPVDSHPGLYKNPEGFYSEQNDNTYIKYSENTSANISPGDSIVWKIEITNEAIATSNESIINYKITDKLPNEYIYDFDKKSSSENFYILKMIHEDETETIFDYFDPVLNEDRSLTWEFSDEQYEINPNDRLYLQFVLINDGTNSFGVYSNTAELILETPINSDNITHGTLKDENTITDTSSVNISLYKTSAQKNIIYKENGEIIDIAYGNNEEKNTLKAEKGNNVEYELIVRNESTASLTNLVVIDRFPYVGDIGVVTGYARNSDFPIKFNELLSVIIENEDGTTIDVTSSTIMNFSNNKTETFNDDSLDWNGLSNDIAQWHDIYDSLNDVNVRFYLKDVIIEPNAIIKFSYTGNIPDDIEITSESAIAWNNFGYSYSNMATSSSNIIAEPAKVGVILEQTITPTPTPTPEPTPTPTPEEGVYNIEILKVNPQEKPIEGVVFKLVNDDTLVEYIATTDSNGKIIFTNLSKGKYTLTETKSAIGYELLEAPISIVLNEQTTTLTENTYNVKTVTYSHDFTTSGIENSFFKIIGSLSTSYGTIIYNNLTLSQCLKLESDASINFSLDKPANLLMVFNPEYSTNLKINDVRYDLPANGIFEISLEAGDYIITKANGSKLFYMELTKEETKESTTTVYEHNFTTSETENSFFNITGNLSSSYGTLIYNDLTLSKCLKMESSTNISFELEKPSKLTLVFNPENSTNIKIDNVKYSLPENGIFEIELEAGTHTITKANMSYLFYINVTSEDNSTDSNETINVYTYYLKIKNEYSIKMPATGKTFLLIIASITAIIVIVLIILFLNNKRQIHKKSIEI